MPKLTRVVLKNVQWELSNDEVFRMNAERFCRCAILPTQCWSFAQRRIQTECRRLVLQIRQSLCTSRGVRCRVLLLCSNSFDEWPKANEKRCIYIPAGLCHAAPSYTVVVWKLSSRKLWTASGVCGQGQDPINRVIWCVHPSRPGFSVKKSERDEKDCCPACTVGWSEIHFFLGPCLKSCPMVPKHYIRNFSSICEV